MNQLKLVIFILQFAFQHCEIELSKTLWRGNEVIKKYFSDIGSFII